MNSKKYILRILSDSFDNPTKINSNLHFKVFSELEKYFKINCQLYTESHNYDTLSQQIQYNIQKLPFKNNSLLKKLLNVFFIFISNIRILSKDNSDLVWIGITSDPLVFLKAIYKIIFFKKKFYVQLYTPSVNKKLIYRKILDFLALLSLKPYRFIGAISERNKKVYKIPEKKLIHAMTGMPDYGFKNRTFNELKLVYVGTLENREIWKSIEGFKIFINRYPNIKISYDIIGTGKQLEIQKIKNSIDNNELNNIVKYHGFLDLKGVNEVFEKCNIGISYMPVNEYFQNLSTKTLEYLLSGMPVIATKNEFRAKIIDEQSGVLCDDNPESFANAIFELWKNKESFNSEQIRKKYEEFSLEFTIKNSYTPALIKIIENNDLVLKK